MVRIRDAFMSADEFGVEMTPGNVVQMSFGAVHVAMSMDAALDLQYRLAGFLAQAELEEYPEEDEAEDENVSESREALKTLSSARRTRRLDA